MNHWKILVALIAWTGAAGAAVAVLSALAPVELPVGGAVLFLSSPGEAVAVWALGLPWVFALFGPGRRLRRAAVAVGLLALVGASAWIGIGLSLPEVATLAPDQASVEVSGAERTTLLVAVDGLAWNAILPMVRSDELPTFARLMGEGSFGVLHSIRSYRESTKEWGYWSPVVWTSMATGQAPRQHGITDFELASEDGNPRIAATYHRTAPAFWNLFSAFDRHVGVVGWWATWPAEEVSGYLVSSHVGLRGSRPGHRDVRHLTHPETYLDAVSRAKEELSREAIQRWTHEEVFPFDQYPGLLTERELATVYDVLWQDRLYFDLTLDLIRGRQLDLYAVYLEGVDVLSHQFWAGFRGTEDEDAPVALPRGFDEHEVIVPAYYRVVDQYLATLLEALPEDATVIVCSDHGFRSAADDLKGADHGPYGVVLARGPGIRRGHNLNLTAVSSARDALRDPVGVLDVLPTLLYLHGLPVADSLGGRILTEMLTRDFVDRQGVVRVRSYGNFASDRRIELEIDPEASEEYRDRLRSLGYIQ